MHEKNHADQDAQVPSAKARLMEEIAFFEARLLQMGHSGDCAYENALARTYQALLDARRHALTVLHTGC
jgi:hypothetical protein